METETTVSTIVNSVGTIFTMAIEWVGDVAEVITSNPVILVFCVLPLVGLAIGMFKRLINVN